MGFELDCVGQLPLHYAIQNGASIEVMEYLFKLNVNAADVRNIFGFTPLHLLFDDNTLVSISGNRNDEEKYIMHVIEVICSLKPSIMLVDDMEDRNILEYTI